MADSLKIAVIGDFNFAFNAHHATNLALEHTADFLEIEINYYWVRISEAASWKAPQGHRCLRTPWRQLCEP